jgi:hypothetical protein
VTPLLFLLVAIVVGAVVAYVTPDEHRHDPSPTYSVAGREKWIDPKTSMWVKRILLFTGLVVLIVLSVAGTLAVVLSIFN